MATDVLNVQGKPTIRRGLLGRLVFEVLRDASEPIKAAEAVRRVESRFEPTPHEASLNNSGIRRWETYLRWTTSWAKTIGWIQKGRGYWSLTPEGRDALDRYPGGDDVNGELITQITRRYDATKHKLDMIAPKSSEGLLSLALDAVGPGSWTTDGDLAQLTGPSLGISTAMRALRHEAAHRVLQADGTVPPTFEWYEHRDESQRDVLESEGLEFTDGHADLASRLTVDELRDAIGLEPLAVRAWLIRGSVSGVNLVPSWLDQGFCSLPASQARNLSPGLDRSQISAIVDQEYSDKSYAARGDKITEFDLFLNRMQIDDLVVTVSDGEYYLGHIAGGPVNTTSTDDRSNLRRDVTWTNVDAPVDYSDIPKALTTKLSTQRTIVDLTSERRIFEGLLQKPGPMPEPQSPIVLELTGLREATVELATKNHVSREWLQEVIDLLWDRRQVIFYGPPGTGKTYLARKIARHLTAAENVKLVQFHPAYSYEDFFEGYRPGAPTDDGSVGFKLTPGPFRRLVDVAREDPSTPYVLIIDEINRANLAKVFGELYFLLEYRDETVDLLYTSGDEAGFSLPDNVFIVGTMNTADRSIALVDAAMRRRFAFIHLHPSEPPTSRVLRSWLAREGKPAHVADLHDALNAAIDDPDFKIGPSYFMRPEVHRDNAGLDRMWRTAILPLLEEHHYGEGLDIAARYGLDAMLKAVRSGASADGHDPSPPE